MENYRCEECGNEFEKPDNKAIIFEDYYGVNSLFETRTKTNIDVCPNCHSENITELYECDNCGEFDDELFDTEGKINGGIGYVCYQCLQDMEG